MSSFDHPALVQNIGRSLASLRQSQPELMQGFGAMSKAAMAPGAIDEIHKELMALAIGITQRCSGCIGFHVKALRRLGCSRQQFDETLAVCVYMGGGPALMYAAESVAAWEAFAPGAA